MTSRKANVQRGTREDLKAVYLAVYDSAIVTDIPDVASQLKLERRYANELFQTLASIEDKDGEALILVNQAAGEGGNDTPHDWWQAGKSVDYQTKEEAEALFDATVPEIEGDPISRQGNSTPYTPKAAKAPRTPQSATNPADLPLCRCGCGFPVNNRKRNYLPGHDARHAGQVARDMAAIPGIDNEDKRTAMLDALPTDALRWKAATMADRLIKKAKGKDDDTVPLSKIVAKVSKDFVKPVKMEAGKVKIGRWQYDAERNSKSGAVTFERKGKTEVATDKVAATFVKEA